MGDDRKRFAQIWCDGVERTVGELTAAQARIRELECLRELESRIHEELGRGPLADRVARLETALRDLVELTEAHEECAQRGAVGGVEQARRRLPAVLSRARQVLEDE